MKEFMDKDFMLNSETAKRLYHEYAEDMPIIDYHCHLSPQEIAENKRFSSITEMMLGGDHYKWRAMRSNGIDEKYITGSGSDFEKFKAFASTLKYAVGNPLYHWTHLELRRFFGIYDILNESSAADIYKRANEMIAGEDFTAKRLIERSNVSLICTTDDPLDGLEHHLQIKNDSAFKTKVLPTFRPDKAVELANDTFAPYIEKMREVCGSTITTLADMKKCLEERLEFFHAAGCRISDHALGSVMFAAPDEAEAEAAFQKALRGEDITTHEEAVYKTALMAFFASFYRRRGWTMQLHMGALRNNNAKMYQSLGADSGFDSINDPALAQPLSALLNLLEENDSLPKTILYNLNPKDNYVLATMLGNFQSSEIPSKMQLGSGWWFCDQRDGMEQQMKALAALGLLGRFVGMLTDSRSFLSYTRHEYFRRIMCNLIGQWVDSGEYPADFDALSDIVKGISFENAKNYFAIDF